MSYFYNIQSGQTIILSYSVTGTCEGKIVDWATTSITENPPTEVGEEFFAVSIDRGNHTITITSDSSDTISHELYLSPTINGNYCEKLITVKQNGTEADCYCIDTITIPSVSSDGVAANTTIGRITLTEGCSMSNVSITCRDLSLTVDSRGRIKTVNAIEANENEEIQSFPATIIYDGHECNCSITQDGTTAKCDCETAAYYIDMFQSSWGQLGTCERNNNNCEKVLIGSGHTDCGYIVASAGGSEMIGGDGEIESTHDTNGFYFHAIIKKNETNLVRTAGVTFTIIGDDDTIIEENCDVHLELKQDGIGSSTNGSCDCKELLTVTNPIPIEPYEVTHQISDLVNLTNHMYEQKDYICTYSRTTGNIYDDTYYGYRMVRFNKAKWNEFVTKYNEMPKFSIGFIGRMNYCQQRAIGVEIDYIHDDIKTLFDYEISGGVITFYPKNVSNSKLNRIFNVNDCTNYDSYADGRKLSLKVRTDAQLNGDGNLVFGKLCDVATYDLYFMFDACPVCQCVYDSTGSLIPEPILYGHINSVNAGPEAFVYYYYGSNDWLNDNNLWEWGYDEESEEEKYIHPDWIHIEKFSESSDEYPTYVISAQTNDTEEDRIVSIFNNNCNEDSYPVFQLVQPPCECGVFYDYTDGIHVENSTYWCSILNDTRIVWQKNYCVKRQIFIEPVEGTDTDHWNIEVGCNDLSKGVISATPKTTISSDEHYSGHWKVRMSNSRNCYIPSETEYYCNGDGHFEYDLYLEHGSCETPPIPTRNCSCGDFLVNGTVNGGGSHKNTQGTTLYLGNLTISKQTQICDGGDDAYIYVSTTQGSLINPYINSNGDIYVEILGGTLKNGSQNVSVDIHKMWSNCDSCPCYYSSVFFILYD